MHKITNILLLAVLAAFNAAQPAAAMPEPLDPPPQQPSAQQWRLPLDAGRVSSFFGASRGRR